MALGIHIVKFKFCQYLLRANSPNFPAILCTFGFRLLLPHYLLYYSASLKIPSSLPDIIKLLQMECGLKIPTSEEEWREIPRTPIDIRRTMVVKDGLREARKSRFNPTKFLKVATFIVLYFVSYRGESSPFHGFILLQMYALMPIMHCITKLKGTVSPYKRISSNRSQMGNPNYTWASGILMSRSCHLQLARNQPAAQSMHP